ncbi:hypothetical protein CTAYLR_007964 [Chrysophaeum taylorii]|uniref:Methyltransferase type 12 domain-containing protein n=1 Tax=Chrysophaeum taylorii TaxID=2483200 RepID=A0AAD7XM26_9STRA|nr:hypothetical protein CTAYLR_007964 [Chrysophaeum taylorii]
MVYNAVLLFFSFFAAARCARLYTMEVCGHQEFTLESLEAVLESQRQVWEQLGIDRPWWSVLSSSEYDDKSALDDRQALEFYATGEEEVRRALEAVDRAVASRARAAYLPWGGGGFGSVALDFGCGVGRLANALARRFFTVLCVDHSARHLDASRATVSRLFPRRAARVVPVPTTAAASELAGHLPSAARPEFVLSLLSLQHMIPQLQVAAVEHLCDALADGGLGYVQLLTGYSPAPFIDAHCDPARAVLEPGMQLHYLPLDEVVGHLAARGCRALGVERCDRFVSIPERNSTSHCVVFAKSGDDPTIFYHDLESLRVKNPRL